MKRVVNQLNEVKIDINLIFSEVTGDVDSDQELIDFATTLNTAANGVTYNDFITWLNNAVN